MQHGCAAQSAADDFLSNEKGGEDETHDVVNHCVSVHDCNDMIADPDGLVYCPVRRVTPMDW